MTMFCPHSHRGEAGHDLALEAGVGTGGSGRKQAYGEGNHGGKIGLKRRQNRGDYVPGKAKGGPTGRVRGVKWSDHAEYLRAVCQGMGIKPDEDSWGINDPSARGSEKSAATRSVAGKKKGNKSTLSAHERRQMKRRKAWRQGAQGEKGKQGKQHKENEREESQRWLGRRSQFRRARRLMEKELPGCFGRRLEAQKAVETAEKGKWGYVSGCKEGLGSMG